MCRVASANALPGRLAWVASINLSKGLLDGLVSMVLRLEVEESAWTKAVAEAEPPHPG